MSSRAPAIENIVFDLGGVLVVWSPDAILASSLDDAEQRAVLRAHLFGHRDWIELDRGAMSNEQAAARAAARSGVPASVVARVLSAVPASLTPIPESIALARSVKDAGYRIYGLSNMHSDSIDYLERIHGIDRLFDGLVVSCRERAVKPEPVVYEVLLTRHGLEPRRTVYFDDVEANLAPARELGVHGVRFENAAQAGAALRSMGVRI